MYNEGLANEKKSFDENSLSHWQTLHCTFKWLSLFVHFWCLNPSCIFRKGGQSFFRNIFRHSYCSKKWPMEKAITFFAPTVRHSGKNSWTSGVALPYDVMSVNATPHANTPLAPKLSCISLMRPHDNWAGCITLHWRTLPDSKPQSTTRKRHETWHGKGLAWQRLVVERGMAKTCYLNLVMVQDSRPTYQPTPRSVPHINVSI